jgi:hypothetical protein
VEIALRRNKCGPEFRCEEFGGSRSAFRKKGRDLALFVYLSVFQLGIKLYIVYIGIARDIYTGC